MRVAQRFSGYTLEEADNLRKACGKKNRELIAAERKKFIAGCATQATARHWASSCSTSSSRSPTTPSTSPIPTGTAWSLSDGVVEGTLSRRVPGGVAVIGEGDKDRPPSTFPSAERSGSRCACRM